jgi:hypothetical protein
MELEEIRGRLDRIRETLLRGGKFDVDWAVEALSAAREYLDDAEDDGPPVDVDDGFVILPMPRYEALREAEEHLQETRFEPDDDGHGERTDVTLMRHLSAAHHEIHRLRSGARARDVDAATPGASAARVKDEVFLKHLQDLQAEIDGIKDRLDEGCGQFNKIKDRLDTAHEQSAALFCSHWDRINALAARMDRMNGLESEFAERVDVLAGRMDATDKAVGETLSTIFDRLGAMTARLNRLDADVMPIRRIGPGTVPEARERDEATRDRLLREIKKVADGVGSTKP